MAPDSSSCPASPGAGLRALVCDDNRSVRLIIAVLMRQLGFEAVEFDDGQAGWAAWQEASESGRAFDIALLDVNMPLMDGFELARLIRAGSPRWTPIVFITSDSERGSVLSGNEVGDDYLIKPLDKTVFTARIKSFARAIHSMRELTRARELAAAQAESLRDEGVLAGSLIARLGPEPGSIPGLRFAIRPGELVSGDAILAAVDGKGRSTLMAIDATGHGLPAAVSLMPAAQAFKAMAAKGFAPGQIASEINRRHREIFPVGRFLAAIVARHDPSAKTLEVWNGGMPEAFISRPGVGAVRRIPPSGFPLGVVKPSRFPATSSLFSVMDGDVFVCASDGFTEPLGDAWAALSEDPALRFETAWAEVESAPYHDDATLAFLELGSAPSSARSDAPPLDEPASADEAALVEAPTASIDWDCSIELGAKSLQALGLRAKDFILDALAASILGDGPLSPRFRLIFSELFANAVEHGLLGMESSAKNDPDCFERWEAELLSRLALLDSARIQVRAKQAPFGILCEIEDSGPGYPGDAADDVASAAGKLLPHGRGLALAAAFSRSLRVSSPGNKARFLCAFEPETRRG